MKIPPELLRSTPRHVALTTSGKAAIGGAVLLFAAALFLGAWLYGLALRADQARDLSRATEGRIVELTTTRGEHPRWEASYRYTVDGQVFLGQARLGRRSDQPLVVGDSLEVRYLPSDPETSWVEGRQPARVPLWAGPLTFAVLAPMAIGILVALRRQTALLSYGRPSIGIVSGSERRHKGRRRVFYKYTLLSGATRTGSYEVDRNPPAAGSSIVIVYDPDNPARRARHPLSLVRCGRV